MTLRPFQRTFIRRAMDPEILTAALCLSRGNGKSLSTPVENVTVKAVENVTPWREVTSLLGGRFLRCFCPLFPRG